METTIDLHWKVSIAIITIAVLFAIYKKNHQHLHRAYVLIKTIKDRHKPFDDSVWQEEDVGILLMKVIAKTSRSMGVTFMLFPEEYFSGTIMAYLYFRAVDTLADDLKSKEHKVKGMNAIKNRMTSLMKGLSPGPFDCQDYKFILETEKQKSYKVILENLHKFDPLWFLLPDEHQRIIYDYIFGLIDGNIKLIDMNGSDRMIVECETAIELGYTHGFLPAFGLKSVQEHLLDGKTEEGKAWKSWAMAINLSQMMTIEKDLEENICFDDALLPMLGGGEKIDPEIVSKVRTKYVRSGLDNYTKTLPFFLYEPMIKSVSLRLLFLQFTVVALNVYEREMGKIGILPTRKVNVWWVMVKSTLQSVLSVEWYKISIANEIERAERMLAQCPKVEF